MLATAAELQAYLGYEPPTAQSALALQIASAVCADACFPWGAERADGDSIILPGTYARELTLPGRPVHDVTSITLDGALLDSSAYRWTPAGLVTRDAGWWGSPRSSIEVVYSHGLDDTPVSPRRRVIRDVLRGVTLSVAARAVANPQHLETFDNLGFGSGEALRVLGLTSAEQAMLDRLRLGAT